MSPSGETPGSQNTFWIRALNEKLIGTARVRVRRCVCRTHGLSLELTVSLSLALLACALHLDALSQILIAPHNDNYGRTIEMSNWQRKILNGRTNVKRSHGGASQQSISVSLLWMRVCLIWATVDSTSFSSFGLFLKSQRKRVHILISKNSSRLNYECYFSDFRSVFFHPNLDPVSNLTTLAVFDIESAWDVLARLCNTD